jgi:glycerophosphoryl diester phosphodiesterase
MSMLQTSKPRLIVAHLLFFALTAVYADDESTNSLDIQGHRGCRGLRPENTLPAFEKALELGVTTLELDVQVTRDRVLVVHPDPKLNSQLCLRDDGSELDSTPFDRLDHADLAGIDCGSLPHSKFPEQKRAPGARIPKLEEVLSLAEGAEYSVRFSIEIKLQKRRSDLSVEDLARLVVDAVKQHGLEDRTIIQSFDAGALAAVRELAPEIPRAYLVRNSRYRRQVDDGTATIISPRSDSLRQETVSELQRQGVLVIPWTVNDTKEIRRFIGWGVDGIISDYPDRVIDVYRESAE